MIISFFSQSLRLSKIQIRQAAVSVRNLMISNQTCITAKP